MKADIYSLEGKPSGKLDLPSQFSEEVRPDIIRRAFIAVQTHGRTPYGAFSKAGQRSSSEVSRRRRRYRGAYGMGIARTPRKVIWKRGRQLGWVGAFAPTAVGGRIAHPPKSSKIFYEKINKKERRKAIRSAIAATAVPEIVKTHGHIFSTLVNVIDSSMENIKKAKEVRAILVKLGLEKELYRIEQKKIRAGRGSKRGRPYITKTGPLLVVSQDCPLLKSGANLPGIDVCLVNELNAAILAPRGSPGRFTIFTEKAIKAMEKDKLFLGVKKEDKK